MGWLELLKSMEQGSDEYPKVLNETEKDLDKLKKIAGRFSKIGSQAKLEEENIGSVITNVCDYFEKRIPSLVGRDGKVTKKVNISIDCAENIHVRINKDLFEWVVENLLKNALDAIDKPLGEISFRVSEKGKEVIIDVTDNGKGIELKNKKDIFRPGFSTKRRGWGLGLSLSKRIIEDYHKGKLTLHDSTIEQGTSFRIRLNK
jgi:signal transduction histidine kinase